MRHILLLSLVFAGVVSTTSVHGGKYRDTEFTPDGGVTFPFPAFMIVHAPGYSGGGGPLTVSVCVSPGGETIIPSVDAAIATWGARPASTSNCTGCATVEEPDPPLGPKSLKWTLVHEFGHCAYGIDHVDQGGFSGSESVGSFTATRKATSFETCTTGSPCPVCDFGQPETCTAESIPGDENDRILPQPPSMNAAEILHWFEDDVNNPFVISPSTTTLTRRRIDLPPGHNWPANANRVVGVLRGFPNAQSVMYSTIDAFAVFSAFAADDVATVANAEVGLDRQPGTGDDYSVQLTRVDDCATADIRIDWVPASTDPDLNIGDLARSDCNIEEVPGQTPIPGLGAQHYRIIPFDLIGHIRIKVNSENSWLELEPIFVDGFESGDTSVWDQTVP